LIPRVVEEAAALGSPVVVVLDDYHRLGRSDVHQQLSRLVELAPPQLRLVIASRADPPLPIARLRASGELVEIRVSDLRFSAAEATEFLNDNLALGLSPDELAVLAERAEGWAAALYLAALAVGRHSDRESFIENFAGTNRFVVDYLGAEVLAQLSPDDEAFLVRCSVLDRLTGSLVDAVLQRTGSASVLHALEGSNLLVVPLDDDRHWYRLHRLFADLLRAALYDRESDLAPVLHARASRWFAEHGFVDEAIEHALASQDITAASDLIAGSFWPYLQRGQVATVHRWLRALPEVELAADARLCLAAAWACGYLGRPEEVESWLARAAAAGHDGSQLRDGQGTVDSATSIVRAGFALGDVGAQVRAGRSAVQHEYENELWAWVAEGCLGIALFWTGENVEAAMHLERAAARLADVDVPQAWTVGQAYLALIDLEGRRTDAHARAGARVERALALIREKGLEGESDTGLVYLARGTMNSRAGELPQATTDLERAVSLLRRGSNALESALAQLELSYVRELSGDRAQARVVLSDVSGTLARFRDPGILAQRLSSMRQRLGMVETPSSSADGSDGLTGRELEVLGYLPGELSQREIAAALFVSFNTVSSHMKSIYRKLGVSSRSEAVEQARKLEIL
jgi:LuxR family maltose regulon positive regulatory protein